MVKCLSYSDRARVRFRPPLVQPKKFVAAPAAGPGMYHTPALEAVALYHDTPDVLSRGGNAAFLSPKRASQVSGAS